jgi:hypothetical protein
MGHNLLPGEETPKHINFTLNVCPLWMATP